ncbi:hypothetical protein HPP92_004872 [Vanilla planifolia]|uniref:Uncharacterized protein n=1 Tax=Vanilla planifolia TaxID=51239 RepID=A0A835RXM0_VANPL|nr:hypothetical protein HPP92_004872 [Vanilla planifolia]
MAAVSRSPPFKAFKQTPLWFHHVCDKLVRTPEDIDKQDCHFWRDSAWGVASVALSARLRTSSVFFLAVDGEAREKNRKSYTRRRTERLAFCSARRKKALCSINPVRRPRLDAGIRREVRRKVDYLSCEKLKS